MAEFNLLESRVAFLQLFEALRLPCPAEAATYYVLYIASFSDAMSFEKLHREAKSIVPHIGARPFRRGREELMKRGFMARVLFSHEAQEFGQEAYLPANPMIVWEEGEESLKRGLGSAMFQSVRNSAEQLSRLYDENFGAYGISIEEGKLTIYYSGMWTTFTLLNLCKKKPRRVSMSISGFRNWGVSLKYFRRCLDTGSKTRLLLDANIDTELLRTLHSQYPEDSVEVRHSLLGRTHRMTLVDDVIAFDSIRILPPRMAATAPAYIGTVYAEKDSIGMLSQEFDARWNGADRQRD